MSLPEQAKLELRWWISNIKHCSKRLSDKSPAVKLQTDTSRQVWGASGGTPYRANGMIQRRSEQTTMKLTCWSCGQCFWP